VVGYDAISNAIIKLRKAFGDSAQNATIIETIPKTGYRLIASVTPTDDKDASAAAFQAEPNSSDDAQAPPTRQTALNRLTFFDWRISAYFMILVMVAVAFWLEPWRTQVETGQAFNRCAAICQPEHRPRAGILCRRHDRGPDHRPVQALGPVCGRAKLRVLLQEQKGQDS
jgi:hypothetical protein